MTKFVEVQGGATGLVQQKELKNIHLKKRTITFTLG